MPQSEHVYCTATAFKMTERVEQWICIEFCVKLEHSSGNYSDGSEGFWRWCNESSANKGAAQMLQRWLRICWKWSMFWNACNKQNTWEWWMCMGCNQQRSVTQVTQPPYSPDLVPRDFWPFPKLKSPLKGERFQWDSGKYDGAADGDWENCVRSQGPTLRETEASLSNVQCFLDLLQ